jgi:hypothetical protein
MRFEGKESWKVTLLVGIPVWLVSYMLFHKLLIIPWPQTLVGDWFPVLRTIPELNMF